MPCNENDRMGVTVLCCMKVSTLLLFAELVTAITAACVHESQSLISS